MKRELFQVVNALLKTAKDLDVYFGQDRVPSEVYIRSYNRLIQHLKETGINAQIINTFPKKLKKDLGDMQIINHKPRKYTWQDSTPKTKMTLIPFENEQEFSGGMGSSVVAISLIMDGIFSPSKGFNTYEVLFSNKNIASLLSLKESVLDNVNKVSKVIIDEVKAVVLTNNMNNQISEKLKESHVRIIEEDGNGVLAALRVAMKEGHFFRGFVNQDTANFLSAFAIASGTKCLFRKAYIEDAIEIPQTGLTSPIVERALLGQDLARMDNKIWNERDICKTTEAYSIIVPYSGWVNSVLNRTTNATTYLLAIEEQIFVFNKKIKTRIQ